jgi:SAM-dependent methyltransferase
MPNPPLYSLDRIESFPGFERAGLLLKDMIRAQGYRAVADIGGGANPLLDEAFINAHDLQYWLIDHSAAELVKAGQRHNTIVADATSRAEVFQQATGGRRFDLVFSHMFLEHIEDPLQAHRNFFDLLKPGGRCVHFYPSPNNLPLALNRLLPEAISRRLIRLAQPARDFAGARPKFKAWYRMCGAPSPRLAAQFEQIGYTVLQFSGYIGHTYYERCAPAALLEKMLRRIALRYCLPLTSSCLLVLEKRA